MEKGFIFGVLSLMGVQFLTALFGALVYARQKSALSVEQRDRGEFRPMVQKALALAADALAGVERIDIDQYRSLAKKLGESIAEIEILKVKLAAQAESIASLHNKLASREKYEKRAAREETPPVQVGVLTPPNRGELEIPDGVDPMEWMKAQGLAQPLEGQVAYQQQPMPLNSVPRGFGKQAVR